eukprot:TRINITY_DN5156_c0_g1_i1.p1 TRINITY_DN5156_c0_g1~~TRINITY_DN5156_c0_g1_i1.p1  ORF type:complete len:436 (-),score=136.79 TRINITY_DN5156_c0_g1_i1:75-1322(-)
MSDDEIEKWTWTSRIDIVPGLGKKTAQRLIQMYKLKNHLGQLAAALCEEKEKGKDEIFKFILESVLEEDMRKKVEKGLASLMKQWREENPPKAAGKKAAKTPAATPATTAVPLTAFHKTPAQKDAEQGGGKGKKGKKPKKVVESSEEEDDDKDQDQEQEQENQYTIDFFGFDISQLPVSAITQIFYILPESSVVSLGAVNKKLRSVYDTEPVWKKLCFVRRYDEAKLNKVSKGAIKFSTWKALHQHLRKELCAECSEQTKYTFTILRRPLCEACERKHSNKYGLCTILDAAENYLIERNELENLRFTEVPSPNYHTSTIKFFLRKHVKGLAIKKFGSEDALEDEILARREANAQRAKAASAAPKKRGGASGGERGGGHNNPRNPRNAKTSSDWAAEKEYIEQEFGFYGITGLAFS